MARCLLASVLCVGLITAAFANQPIDKKEVAKLVAQLEGGTRASREEAESELRKLGAPVLALLPNVDARTSGEKKMRLLRIREHLEQQRIGEAAEESRVSLQGTMALSDAFAAIEEQTGNVIVDYRSRLNQRSDDTEISLELEDVPFWEALDHLLDEAGLTVYPYVGESRQLAVIAAGDNASPRQGRGVYQGLFRLEPTTLTLERNLRDVNGDRLRMQVELLWEPRALPILVRHDLDDIEFTTDNGETLSVTSTGEVQLPVLPSVSSIDLNLPLELPTREAKSIASLKGHFSVLVPGGDVTFEFTDLKARNVQQRKGGLTVVLDQVRRNGGVQQIFLRLRLEQASDSLQSHLEWVENNRIQLLDPAGRPADEPGYEKYLERDSEVGYSYIFPVEEDLDGWKLIYTTPAGIAEVPVEYELTDISLP